MARQVGVPRTDVERMMRHFGVDRKTAEIMLKRGVKLPPRGTGLSTGRAER